MKKIYEGDKTTVNNNYTLDYIFFDNSSKNSVEVQKYFVIEYDLTKRASDHCPVFTDIVLK